MTYLAEVLARLYPASRLVCVEEESVTTSVGAVTRQVVRLVGEVQDADGDTRQFSVFRKSVQPLASGRHAPFAQDPGHWAYWRREVLAYESGLLPSGPGLVAPRCLGVDGDAIYLEDVTGEEATVDQVAAHLAGWQSRTRLPDVPWLCRDQLGQRVHVTDLDWSAVDADGRVVGLWERRYELLDRLRGVPWVLSHGDYSLGNLVGRDGDTVALDWGMLGSAPVGSDLAYLALSAGVDPSAAFLAAAGERWAAADVKFGFRATLALVGSSRVHWMLSRGMDLPGWYADLLQENSPT